MVFVVFILRPVRRYLPSPVEHAVQPFVSGTVAYKCQHLIDDEHRRVSIVQPYFSCLDGMKQMFEGSIIENENWSDLQSVDSVLRRQNDGVEKEEQSELIISSLCLRSFTD